MSSSARSLPQVGHGELFHRVKTERASQHIVEQIRMLILEGALSPGDRLPSERDLVQHFGVSRVTVREALRALESRGLLNIRVGAHGGAFLSTPSTGRLGEGLADLISLSSLTAADVTEARLLLETGALPLVIDRATDDDVADLLRLTEAGRDALETGTYDVGMSAAFHIRLAECAHNSAVTMLIHSFQDQMVMSLQQARLSAPEMGSKGNAEHRKLALAVKRRDLIGADRILRVHLQRTASRVAESH